MSEHLGHAVRSVASDRLSTCAPRTLRAALALLALAWAATMPAAAGALTLPPGFGQETVISGLVEPTDIEIAPGGRVFVAEKSGAILTYDSLADPTPHTFADLSPRVQDHSSRGLLALALDPEWPAEPYVYVYYTLDAPIGGTPPTYGDDCPGHPDTVNCLVSAQVSRLPAAGEDVSGPEHVLVNDWCEQFPYHTGGGLEFGADGYLYVTGGDGARHTIWDYGQFGDPVNPCGDPPGNAPGTVLTPPTSEGGRLRAQDLRTAGDPLGLGGSLIRIDPDTGEGVLGNPMFSSPEPNARRMLAHGFRNAVGMAIRPGTNDVWIADRGAGYFEELDRVPDPSDPVRNFGWPCYEGGIDENGDPYPRIRPRSDEQDLDICEDLYAEATATAAPYWAYDHEQPVVDADEDCDVDPGTGNQIAGPVFYPAAGSFPVAYSQALFFADRNRHCLFAMLPGPDGLPRRDRVVVFAEQAGRPVALEIGPGGELLYVDQSGDAIHRVTFTGDPANQPPTAVAQADTITGNRPLTVAFDATASSDPDSPSGDLLVHEWDLDGDGELDDSTAERPAFTYTEGGTYDVTLRVTDTSGAADTDTITITVGSGPGARIDSPVAGATWATGDQISFSGGAVDEEDGDLPASALEWSVTLRHCSGSDCHAHPIGEFAGVAAGTFTAPDHSAPGEIDVQLRVTDSDGETDVKTAKLTPRTFAVDVDATPPGAVVTLNGDSLATPGTAAVVQGSTVSLSAPDSQVVGNTTYRFSSWTDAEPQSRTFVATQNRSFAASFAPLTPGTHTLVFAPEADVRAEEADPATNFGADAELRTDRGGGQSAESFLRFRVTGLTGRVTDARLRLRAVSNTVDGPALRSATGDWSESGLTWANRPAPSTAPVSDAGAIGGGDWVEWDATGLVAGEGQVDLHLAQTGTDGVSFHSREATAVNRPRLVVTVANDAYPRPRGASPVRASLVLAYDACTTPNAEHAAPLEHPACSPPVPASDNVTVGTPDANGRPAGSIGLVRYSVRPGIVTTPEDEADVAVQAQVTDVRDARTLLDYLGELQVRAGLRATDRGSGPAQDEPATSEDVELPVTLPCAATLDVDIGAACAVSTTLDALLPGAVTERMRGIWELGQVEVLDGGPDGDVDTGQNEVFARQGVLVP